MALQEYRFLGDETYVFEPELPAPELLPKDDPTTIFLLGWGDCQAKHLAKFSDGYRALYPFARIVVTLSPIRRTMYSSYSERTAYMLPAVKAVTAPRPGIEHEMVLMQCFSNTGGINMVGAMNAYRTLLGKNEALPTTLLICDSTPGGYEFFSQVGRWAYAMALGMASFFPWPFFITKYICVGMLSVHHFLGWIRGEMSIAQSSCIAVNNPELADSSSARLYLASKADKIIAWEDIEVHAAEAKMKGYETRVKVFEKSSHVGHMRMYPEEYWAEIADAWKMAVKHTVSS